MQNMQLVSYKRRGYAEPTWRAGLERDGHVIDLTAIWPDSSKIRTVRDMLWTGPTTMLRMFHHVEDRYKDGTIDEILPMDSVDLGPPIPNPDKIICVGHNYADHIAETGAKRPKAPELFAKFPNSLIGPSGTIILPRATSAVDYEGELAVVIGSRCQEVSVDEALDHVIGYTVFNDVSARDLQMQTSQWLAGKALDTFAPMGPGIAPTWQIHDPQNLQLRTWVNGTLLQDAHTSQMIFSVAELISFISSIMTLEFGDIIATGTPAGVGFKRTPPIYLKHGDTVEVEIEGIGRITNPVIRQD